MEIDTKRKDEKMKPWSVATEHTTSNRKRNDEILYHRILHPQAARKAQKEAAKQDCEVLDVYARIPTRPSIYWYTGGTDDPENKADRPLTQAEHAALEKKKLEESNKEVSELLSAVHGVSLFDDEIVTPTPTSIATPLADSGKVLSLSDYRKQSALK
eukprot:NODE_10384_length_595_cov_89.245763_g10110_i0.p1 GENE.NODE_10384_length_595_cov_89.245763_g10110_i0~~NODE_10384_length_595_cov_89.245763_g10110_i0.p1  ORF type:complete len:157 (+),score=27.60 NODE_10384_length_595_cov_89.245763_g10110_i0:42-512(+)